MDSDLKKRFFFIDSKLNDNSLCVTRGGSNINHNYKLNNLLKSCHKC